MTRKYRRHPPTWRKDILGTWQLRVGAFDVAIGSVYLTRGDRWKCRAGDSQLDVKVLSSVQDAMRLVETALELPVCPVQETP